MEILGPWGVSKKFSSVCLGHTSLDDYLEQCAHAQGRVVVREPESEKGYLYRSDHLEYMRVGVPCLAAFFPCADHLAQRQDYVKTTYHKPTDKVKPDWDMAGAVLDTQLFFEVGVRILADGTRAKWSATSEFKP
jgi:Zn-dependent M28 family amino/carboxypeptidase